MKDAKISRCYTVSAQDMLDIWMESFHHKDHVVVVWDAKVHYKLLKELGLNLSEAALYNNKVLTVQLESMGEAVKLFDIIPKNYGPHAQVYSFGKLIKDNIEG